MNNSVSGYILIGGESSRMGRSKGNLVFKGLSFIENLSQCLNNFCDKVYLVGNKEDYDQYGLERIKDKHLNLGPISGIQSALEHSSSAWNFILSCDIPNLNPEDLKKLLAMENLNSKARVLMDKYGIHPLLGLYPRGDLKIVESQILKGDYKMMNLLENIGYQAVTIIGENEISNINTQDDYKKLKDEFES